MSGTVLPNSGSKNIEQIPEELCRALKGILFDIDDTFTYEGRILPGAFSALWQAREEGLLLLPITGRPAGWADHIARMWPVDAVIGENGAFYFCYDRTQGRLRKHYVVHDPSQREENRRRLAGLFTDLHRIYPSLRTASDQPYRECDLAVDYCEDTNPALSLEEVRRIQETLEGFGARTKISSIHVNAWFGDYDKLSTCKWYFQREHGIDLERERERFFFCGDSPNDAPMFAFFPLSVGVAGIRRFHEAGLMGHMPSFLADREGGLGFEETVRAVLEKRA